MFTHFEISMAKSLVRLVGFIVMAAGTSASLVIAAALLVGAELLGIWEETGGRG